MFSNGCFFFFFYIPTDFEISFFILFRKLICCCCIISTVREPISYVKTISKKSFQTLSAYRLGHFDFSPTVQFVIAVLS